MPLTAAAFHATTSTHWRRRLAASTAPIGTSRRVRQVIDATGVLTVNTHRTLDSTILDDAVATQDTAPRLIAAIRRLRREVPRAITVVARQCSAHDYEDPGNPAIAWNDAQAREALVYALVSDEHRVVGHLPEQELGPKAADAVALLSLVAGQDVETVEGPTASDGRWRIAQWVTLDRVISTVDPDNGYAGPRIIRFSGPCERVMPDPTNHPPHPTAREPSPCPPC